jgi:PERQ amino acid-rich with GYF domain-containing protein
LSDLYAGGWEPQTINGTSTMSWGKRDENSKDAQPGADICWENDGGVLPLGIADLTEEEKEVSIR